LCARQGERLSCGGNGNAGAHALNGWSPVVWTKKGAHNGLGPWWNAGASHMNDACRKKEFDELGLVNLLETLLGNRTA